MTLNQLFHRAWNCYWKPQNTRWARVEVRRLWDRHIGPNLGERDAGSLSVGAVRGFHTSLSHIPTTANRCLEVLSRLYSFGQEYELIDQGVNPARLVRANTEQKRGRYATPEELSRIGKVLDDYAERYPLETAFIRILALTGARPSAIAKARKVDLSARINEGAILYVKGKTTARTGYDEAIIVPPAAMLLLDRLGYPKGMLTGKVNYHRAWNDIRTAAGCPDLWLRDFRRTFATTGLSNGVGLGVIGELLGHRSTQTTKIYAKLLPTARFRAAGEISQKIGAHLGYRQAGVRRRAYSSSNTMVFPESTA